MDQVNAEHLSWSTPRALTALSKELFTPPSLAQGLWSFEPAIPGSKRTAIRCRPARRTRYLIVALPWTMTIGDCAASPSTARRGGIPCVSLSRQPGPFTDRRPMACLSTSCICPRRIRWTRPFCFPSDSNDVVRRLATAIGGRRMPHERGTDEPDGVRLALRRMGTRGRRSGSGASLAAG